MKFHSSSEVMRRIETNFLEKKNTESETLTEWKLHRT